MADRDWESLEDMDAIPWADFTDEEFVLYYHKVFAPILEEEGHDPSVPPKSSTVVDLGFASYREAVRRHLDYTFKDFLLKEVGLTEPDSQHEFRWPIDDEETKEWLDEYIREIRNRDAGKESESTVERIAYNLYSFLREWENVIDSSAIITTLQDAEKEEAHQLILKVYDRIDREVPSENTKYRYGEDHEMWFDFLTRPGNPLDYNPIPDVLDRFNWKRSNVSAFERPALSAEQVKKLWRNTESKREKMLIIAACAWGLRRGEIASLHVSQLILDPKPEDGYEGPIVQFDERKNGPSQVNIVYGKHVAEEFIEQLKDEYGDGWNGYLFQSRERKREHVNGRALLTHMYKPLARRAGITVEGDDANLRHARRYWYQEYLRGIQRFRELVIGIADEQGSKDPDVVRSNYLGEIDELRFCRLWMRNRLESSFGQTTAQREPLVLMDSVLEILRDMVFEKPTPVDRFIAENRPRRSGWLEDEKGHYVPRGTVTAALFATAIVLAFI